MQDTFLGIPSIIWSLVALGVAVVYFFVWPHPHPGDPPRPAWAHVVLRWFHSLVWVLLAGAFYLWDTDFSRVAGVLAFAALVLYAAFLFTTIRTRRPNTD